MGFFQLLLYILFFLWIKCITRHFKTQIDEKKMCPWVGLEPTKVLYISRAEIEKFFVRFLVQVKIAKSPFEINWPLIIQCFKYFLATILMPLLWNENSHWIYIHGEMKQMSLQHKELQLRIMIFWILYFPLEF